MLGYLTIPLLVASWSWAAALSPYRGEALERRCQFSLGGLEYDLCPITTGGSRNWPMVVDIDAASLPGQLSHHSGFDSSEIGGSALCPDGRWMCLRTSRNGALLARYPLGRSTLIVDYSRLGAHLSLFLPEENHTHHAIIQLICDPNLDQPEPTFLEISDGNYKLRWVTNFGCSLMRPASSIESVKLLESNDTGPNSGEDSELPDDDSDKLVDPTLSRSHVRRTLAIIITVIGITVAAVCLLIYHPSRPLNFLLAYVQAIPHLRIHHLWMPVKLKQTGESRLVRWAQEDMGIQDDFMVNANESHDEEALDEYIPLSPNPRKGGGRVRNYGTAERSL